MNILVVYAHPSKKSYTFQILQILVGALMSEGHTVEVSDLYEMEFQSDLTRREYDREGFGNVDLPVSDDVRGQQKKITWADFIFFLYPVWWSDCPAKLKGWFDRVYTVGFAYGSDANRPDLEAMKIVKLGQVICTAGHPNEFLNEVGIAESMKTIMLNDRLGKRFENKAMTILGGTLAIENVRQLHIDQVTAIAKGIRAYFR